MTWIVPPDPDSVPAPAEPEAVAPPVQEPAAPAPEAARTPTSEPVAPPELIRTTVGLPFGDRLPTFDSAGTGVIWHVPDDLAALIGTGILPRRDLSHGVSAEYVAVDQDTQRIHAPNQSWPAVLLDPDSEPAGIPEFRERLRRVLVDAARRGESVILAPGGLREFAWPAARASVIKDDDGTWVSVIEAFPPVQVEGWEDAEHDEHSSRMSAPVDEETLVGGAMLLMTAVATFTPGPEVVGLYFEDAPDGPWTD